MFLRVIICLLLFSVWEKGLEAQSSEPDREAIKADLATAEEALKQGLQTRALEIYQKLKAVLPQLAPRDSLRPQIHEGYRSLLANSGAYREEIRELQSWIRDLQDLDEADNSGRIYFLYGSIGANYLKLGEADSAVATFRKALPYAVATGSTISHAAAWNNLGMGYMASKVWDSAYYAFDQAYTMILNSDQSRGGLSISIRDNLGDYHMQQDNFDKAIDLFEQNLSIAQEDKRERRVFLSLMRLLQVHLELGETDKATYYLRLLKNDSDFEEFLQEEEYRRAFFRSRLWLGILVGEASAQLVQDLRDWIEFEDQTREEAQQALNSLLGSLSELRVQGVEKLLASEISKSQQRQMLLNESRKETRTVRILLFILVGLAVLIVAMLILLYRRRLGLQTKKSELKEVQAKLLKYEVKTKELESQQLQERLSLKDKDLTDMAIDISRRRDWTEQILAELKKVRKSGGQISGEELRQLISNIQGQIQADEKLKIFQENIEQVNQEFFEKLIAKFPDLTKTEKELCGLIRLNLSSKEISNVRGVSPNSVKVGKHRLRKKLNLDPEDDIYTYLQQF